MRIRGFTLIELMIVVAIIAIIAAIAIPNLLRSRMAANESSAIAACKTYAEAQDIYLRTDYDQDGVKEFCQHLKGTPSSIFGLFSDGTSGPNGQLQLIDAAFANAEGAPGAATPRAGYVFQILTSQGPSAPGGAKTYLQNKPSSGGAGLSGSDPQDMLNGYALSAIPSSYDSTGRNSYAISQTGIVLQKDNGAAGSAAHPATFDPDTTWSTSE